MTDLLSKEEVLKLQDEMAELCFGVRRLKGWSFENPKYYNGFIDYYDWRPCCNTAPTWQRQMIIDYADEELGHYFWKAWSAWHGQEGRIKAYVLTSNYQLCLIVQSARKEHHDNLYDRTRQAL